MTTATLPLTRFCRGPSLAAATVTYDATLAEMLDGILNDDEQRSMHEMVRRLLAETTQRSHS
ncbi:hypothetical protein [Paractinoplanes hotanensis]|uniref:Uncharacterized protein n=1 Tax=Paractinoplanes hotanensis TaxID=2906497 RepID=A0ABT0XV04_9ACTN|nr:hypothetical protein [Actinoplanes hotanensis]MCM4077621.1 hypothetical protein [Actinoplanes hotanensis]